MSSDRQPVYTEKTKCRDCYKCVRHCPVKAIKVEDSSARIIDELCIYCGRCVYVCPAQAKKVRSDVNRVKALIDSGRPVALSLAPSWSTGIFGSKEVMISHFKSLGFAEISETALGAEIVSSETASLLKGIEGLSVSSACPSVVELFRKYYPRYLPSLSPIPSPLEAHALFLKKLMGSDVPVVFAGPCIAKKLEADSPDSSVDYALTFDEILKWMEESLEPLFEDREGANDFFPFPASNGSLYSLEGGMIHSLKAVDSAEGKTMVPLSGTVHIMEALEDLDLHEDMMLELLSCPGGCVNGSGFRSCGNQFSFRRRSLEYFGGLDTQNSERKSISLTLPERTFLSAEVSSGSFTDLLQINEALKELGKEDEEDRLDCGGCGYNSCRDFAVAYLSGMGEKPMCVTNMRKRAQKKVDMLLRTLPMGVVIVNRKLQIVDCNREFASLFAESDSLCDDDYVKGHNGLPLINFVDLSSYLGPILSGEKNLFQEKIKMSGRFLKISFFSIERGHLAGVILQDITTTSLKREDVIRKAEEVISKNLKNVQQIASLLGENAAETEIILRSLSDQFQFASGEEDL